MSIKGKPNPPAPSPMLKNAAAAPVIYFDGVPAVGAWSGNIELELAARLLMPQRDGEHVSIDMGCVAHLRCSAAAAIALRDSINNALKILDKNAKAVRNEREFNEEMASQSDYEETSPLLKN
jgi:hypothetical protein